ncbi:chloroplast lipoate protein ligase [Moniliophthora roreri MCA 2997]|uniref:lipoyl(octanoyl) transferase n=1 Tax=Moniliophthora roreri (strain MCA 2997) TaxID=1381753 RepID=V2XIS8_MONRO|nr:chloroplast lipoate protein ligase [Moniliophthora roreri MCA 2997]
MSSPLPIFYHHFRIPLPYLRTLELQETIHQLQLAHRRSSSESTSSSHHPDLLLLLEHRPVYTAGRRQTDESTRSERERLEKLGAEFVLTKRGGEVTYHGPGQVVGYPLLDLGRAGSPLSIRDYICYLQRTLTSHLTHSHGIKTVPSEHTGVFLSEMEKIGSIGVQVRHRLTTHGFAMNVERGPEEWFERVVACGLVGVRATSIQSAKDMKDGDITVTKQIPALVSRFGNVFGREMVELELASGLEEYKRAIQELENEAARMERWLGEPIEHVD